MHNKIIRVINKIFKRNNAEDIKIEEITKEDVISAIIEEANYCDEKNHIQLNQNLTASPKQLKILKKLSNGKVVKLSSKERAIIILEVLEKSNNSQVAKKLDIKRKTVIKWRNRWLQSQAELERVEKEEPWKLNKTIDQVLSDAYRSGKPNLFTMEQIAHIIYLSLQKPESVGVPISHWTSSALAQKAIEDKIVDKISPRHISRYLKEIDLKVHQYKGWLNSKDKVKDPKEFEKRVNAVCEVYHNSSNLKKEGVHVISCDEKTGSLRA